MLSLLLIVVTSLAAQKRERVLDEGWMLQGPYSIELPARVPGVVQLDLMAAGRIPDPFVEQNIDSVQWVESHTWTYRCRFTVNEAERAARSAHIRFDGLDTYCTISLNGHPLGDTDNMFRQWRFPVTELLQQGSNELIVTIHPVRSGSASLRERVGLRLPHDSDTSGIAPFVRKAAYSFGWDFAPRLVTMGIWQQVVICIEGPLPTMEVAVEHLRSDTQDHVLVTPKWTGTLPSTGTLRVHWNGHLRAERAITRTEDWHQALAIDVREEALWWPRGTGPQAMHDLRVEAHDGEGVGVVASVRQAIGLRSIALDRSRDTIGAQFRFIVNGEPVFMRGCNLIPPDMFLPRAGDSAWVALVGYMAEAHMNMVRVWSGGVYPPEAFFTACDTAGILVWQDLMFGYMVPAGDSTFLSTAREEVRQQVARIGTHPSLAVFCGNNELDVAWSNWGWQQRYGLHGADSAAVWKDHLAFFHDSLTRWTAPHPYTPTSPLSNWGNSAGLRAGDLHYWGVWHADSSLSSYSRNVGRFMSEYGFQSYPDSATLGRYLAPHELVLGSAALARRQLSYRTDKPLYDRILEELGQRPATLGEFCSATQAVQALGYGLAVDAHWAAYPRCMGTLLWQLNDCWPGPSWSVVDHLGVRKQAFHVVGSRYRAISEQSTDER
ncbi:MAG: hypothetical protein R2817_01375 [Flavobacteriales bacterium]